MYMITIRISPFFIPPFIMRQSYIRNPPVYPAPVQTFLLLQEYSPYYMWRLQKFQFWPLPVFRKVLTKYQSSKNPEPLGYEMLSIRPLWPRSKQGHIRFHRPETLTHPFLPEHKTLLPAQPGFLQAVCIRIACILIFLTS